jgi:hypothetical protein
MLERESAITPEEAANVRQIVTQYFKDEEARSARVQEIRSQAIASGGDSCQAVFSDPDYMALHKQQWGLIDQSIAQLVSALGARSFSRLDLYTRHMNDRSNATQSSHQTPGSEQQSGVGK